MMQPHAHLPLQYVAILELADAPSPDYGSGNQTGTEVQTTQQQDVQTPEREPDVVYVPTPQEVVEEMLALAKVTKDVLDLGSGDGRSDHCRTKFGTRGVGIDINPERIRG